MHAILDFNFDRKLIFVFSTFQRPLGIIVYQLSNFNAMGQWAVDSINVHYVVFRGNIVPYRLAYFSELGSLPLLNVGNRNVSRCRSRAPVS